MSQHDGTHWAPITKEKENMQVLVAHSQSVHVDRFQKHLRDKRLDWNYQVLSKYVGGNSSTFL